jgi:hypothetical protein
MAATALTVYTLDRTGKDLAAGAAALVAVDGAGGNKFLNTGVEFLIVKNASQTSLTVTLDIQATIDGQAVTDPTVTVLAGSTKLIGPFPTAIYSDGSGYVTVTFGASTSITAGAFKVS